MKLGLIIGLAFLGAFLVTTLVLTIVGIFCCIRVRRRRKKAKDSEQLTGKKSVDKLDTVEAKKSSSKTKLVTTGNKKGKLTRESSESGKPRKSPSSSSLGGSGNGSSPSPSPIERLSRSSLEVLSVKTKEKTTGYEPIPFGEHETKSMAKSLEGDNAYKKCVYKEGKHIEHPGCMRNKQKSDSNLTKSPVSSSPSISGFKRSESVFKYLPPGAKVKSRTSNTSLVVTKSTPA